METRIKVQIVPSRSGKTWNVFVNGWRVIKSTREPLTAIAQRLLAAGHNPQRAIIMTRTPDGPCRVASTIGNAAVASARRHPFRAPTWTPVHSNGGVQ